MNHFTMDCLRDTKAYLSWEEGGSWNTKLACLAVSVLVCLYWLLTLNYMNPEESVGVGLLGICSVVRWVVNPYIWGPVREISCLFVAGFQ